jgi:hypothetical protein
MAIDYNGKFYFLPSEISLPQKGQVQFGVIANSQKQIAIMYKNNAKSLSPMQTLRCLGANLLFIKWGGVSCDYNLFENIFIYYEVGKINLYDTKESVFANIKIHYYDYWLELNSQKKPLLRHLSNISGVEQSEIENLLLTLDKETFLAEMLKYEKSKIDYKIYD